MNKPFEMEITIRRLKLGEADLFREVRLAALKDAPYAFSATYESALERSPESWVKQADNSAQGIDRATFIAFSDDKPIGMAALYRTEDQVETGELLQVWISPEYRGVGVANQLIEEIFNWAKENNFNQVVARVTKGNTQAVQFYINYGFSVMDTSDQEDNKGMLLTKEISNIIKS